MDPKDPAFENPTKPVGPFYGRIEAQQLQQKKGYHMKEDAGRGWRRVVPSPNPLGICEQEMISHLLTARDVVIASGGGGIPVLEQNQRLQGIEAVIDKDRSAQVLAKAINADVLLILTDVPRVKLHYGTPQEQDLETLNVSQAQEYMTQGHFAAGSMGPKVDSCVQFAGQGKRAVIASLAQAFDALEGQAGTQFHP